MKEYERVKIISLGIIGTIVDKRIVDGKVVYIVESDSYVKGSEFGYPLYDCLEAELERI